MANRRYKVGDKPEYDRWYDRLMLRSPILNEDAKDKNIDFSGYDFQDSRDLQKIKRRLTETHENRDRQPIDGKIPQLEKQLKQVEVDFKNHKQRLINEGKSPAKNMPKEIEDHKLETEARYDIAKQELAEIEKLMKQAQKVEDKEHEKEVLQNGCKGSSKLTGGVIAEVDGQRVELFKNVPVISDSFSPYDGMRTADYFDYVVKPWSKLQKELPDRLKLAKRLRSEGVREFNLEEEYSKRVKDKLNKHGQHLMDIEWKRNLRIPSWPKQVKKFKET